MKGLNSGVAGGCGQGQAATPPVTTNLGDEGHTVQVVEELRVMEGYQVREHSKVLWREGGGMAVREGGGVAVRERGGVAVREGGGVAVREGGGMAVREGGVAVREGGRRCGSDPRPT